MVKAIRSSPQRIDKLKEGIIQANLDALRDPNDDAEALPNLLSQLDVPTRWSSCYHMIKRCIVLQKGLDFVTANLKELRQYELAEEEWNLLSEIVNFLEPFAVTTKYIEGFKYPTLSLVIPLYNKLMDTTEDLSMDFTKSTESRRAARLAFDKLINYYDKTTPLYLVATVLDPRLKLVYFQQNGWEEGDERSGGDNLIETRVIPV